ncbi:MAG: hypothetical protein ACYCQJ_10145 [Nitrososphaerales archaeon]
MLALIAVILVAGVLCGFIAGYYTENYVQTQAKITISGYVWVTRPIYPYEPSEILFYYFRSNCSSTNSSDVSNPQCYCSFSSNVSKISLDNSSFTWFTGNYSISVPNDRVYEIRFIFSLKNSSELIYTVGLVEMNTISARLTGYNITCTGTNIVQPISNYACFGPTSAPPEAP